MVHESSAVLFPRADAASVAAFRATTTYAARLRTLRRNCAAVLPTATASITFGANYENGIGAETRRRDLARAERARASHQR